MGAVPRSVDPTEWGGGFGKDMAARAAFREDMKKSGSPNAEVSDTATPVAVEEPVKRVASDIQSAMPKYNIPIRSPWFTMQLQARDWFMDENCLVLIGGGNINLTPGVTDLTITLPDKTKCLCTLISQGSLASTDDIWVFSIEEEEE